MHNALPLGPVADYNHSRDLTEAAKDFPDIEFMVYHAGLLGVSAAQLTGELPRATEFCQMMKKDEQEGARHREHLHGARLGVWAAVVTNPTACAYWLGKVIGAFDADHVYAARVSGVGVHAKRDELPKDLRELDEDGVPGGGVAAKPSLVRLHVGAAGMKLRPPSRNALRHDGSRVDPPSIPLFFGPGNLGMLSAQGTGS